ncbi:hypothetical protein PF006_g19561 [Phytophthora fragariae]|uniref:Uncharacterized protein n=1 Tax=Phytophthora fragariae TaxID=53985 RepID=A0A6A3SCF3_9STRA|nr:hypothetical protein PF006_g19561 [Phytophthora fragariae]
MYNPRALKGSPSKIFAIYHSNFKRLLVLDADYVPERDPPHLEF